MVKEMWKDIPDYEGIYQASNLGRIKSLDRVLENTHERSIWKFKAGKVLKPYTTNCGYKSVLLSRFNKKRHKGVHCLVMLAFKGARAKGFDVDHIDGDKNNNNLDNLQYLTHKDNCKKRSVSKTRLSKLAKEIETKEKDVLCYKCRKPVHIEITVEYHGNNLCHDCFLPF